MSLRSSVQIALRALGANPLRSLLTMLGVIIGVAAVVTMVSIGQGARQSVAQQVQALGSNLLTVFPGSVGQFGVRQGLGSSQTLTWEDAQAIAAEVPTVEAVAAEFSRTAQAVRGNANTVTSVAGVTPAFQEVRNFFVAEGSFFTDVDMASRARVAVLGRTVVENLFGDRSASPLGARIKINRVTFTVIGVMEEKGATGFIDRDDVIFVPLSTAQRRLFGVDFVRSIYVKVRTAEEMSLAQEQVETLLRRRHRIAAGADSDFTIRNQADIIQTFQGVTQTMTLLLGSIAAVSLLVGGIGIMNIMLVSVTERTREIGIRKAVGATPGDIMIQFVVESLVLSLTGGAVGLLLGIGGSRAVSRLAGWATLVSPGSLVMAVTFAAAVGIFFGIYPARRAAALDPIVALRYE
ncbi:MAG: ABC transporter permease [Armatimonadota bacterium]|nr:ABC transporter permease [Armatimonadota bacterium]MDR7450878.1 ABC transporter permease [Armatimonadota bacterium]MDR7465800.1 ABC transporter permease [Armatimonadota bacterium]MDR7493708.1 ABC transporter permease [Armatimonadota bacterium]MDR7500570.1 ABC transporter permease [Armatimonadota bacterium]